MFGYPDETLSLEFDILLQKLAVQLLKLFLLKTFARNFSNIDFFLKILPLKDDELVMLEM